MNVQIDTTVVVNLPRRRDRMDRFWSRWESHQVSHSFFGRLMIFEAFDGRAQAALTCKGKGNRVQSAPLGPLTQGEIGCHLSHVAIAKMSRACTLGNVLVLEDDVRILGETKQWIDFLLRVPDDWQMLHLSTQDRSQRERPIPIDEHVDRRVSSWGSYAYMLRAGSEAQARIAIEDGARHPYDWLLSEIMEHFPTYGPRTDLVDVDRHEKDSDCKKA